MWRRLIRRFRDHRQPDDPGSRTTPAIQEGDPIGSAVAGDPGLQTVDFVFWSMRIDDGWSVREPRGFTWWGQHLAQRVWADPVRMSPGMEVYRVQAETHVLRGLPNSEGLAERLTFLNQFASLSAYLWDSQEGRLTLRCGAYVHAENVAWLRRVVAAAVGIQIADAHIKTGLAGMLGGQPDVSAHPAAGRRETTSTTYSRWGRFVARSATRTPP